MAKNINNILEFISIWGNSYFYSPLSEGNAYSPEALEQLANAIDAESGTGKKTVRGQRLRYLAKTRAERLKKLEAAKDEAMFDDKDDEKVKEIEGIQSRVIGPEKAEYDSSRKPGTSLEKDNETGEAFKVLGNPKTGEEQEEKPGLLTRIFGAMGKGAERVRIASDFVTAGLRGAGAATVPVFYGRNTNVPAAIGDVARQGEVTAKSAEYKSAIKDEISALREQLRNPNIGPKERDKIRQRIRALQNSLTRTRTRTTRADLLRFGATATMPNRNAVSNGITPKN